MIVVSTINKSLKVIVTAALSTTPVVSAVVSYWSINNATNVWTPDTFEISIANITPNVPTAFTILPAPASGETRVVENIWIHLLGVTTSSAVAVVLDVGGVEHILGSTRLAAGVLENSDTIILGRDGNFQKQQFNAAQASVAQNVN